ncbi:heparan-alpha-glucosaminide N-acetyltransferase domain-containing protein [Bacteroides sp.]|uniref:heparan-alpha-glucosaminide N-acetyltransferase domain-containing protein n=1 Tax=Bacteroides sp. TaxID=29523 RepID=UPI0026132CF7|nr:heparan-alpha-glucosaminide N-acetyltransferase domain-containing protein [Bacteroides sp.]MDD3037989.1 heparan-alpha-glucosaminide N-acetyltransferase domain-containing protein [Bacteroides sp.]
MKRERITSIDALRAITLLGILLVHTAGLFGFNNEYNDFSSFLSGNVTSRLIYAFLPGRCSGIFSILFGVSFYLILRNPANSSKKFFWRCAILVLIGILNKLFYTYDALMWYGMCGMILVFLEISLQKCYLFYLSC